ncbi:hypothetical protein CDAR_253421 [Caerostris darwini]|uniref:Uncharacterized protein n=1 Tax=Caerostris darwini TaxID=1538125 RepID=A0AAV4MJ45_9ARAC|nr:hypothetical protein CDAR_253421 [Caerostris darwini]
MSVSNPNVTHKKAGIGRHFSTQEVFWLKICPMFFAVIRCEMLRWYLMSNDMLISDWFNLNKSVKGTQTESLKDCDITSKRKEPNLTAGTSSNHGIVKALSS